MGRSPFGGLEYPFISFSRGFLERGGHGRPWKTQGGAPTHGGERGEKKKIGLGGDPPNWGGGEPPIIYYIGGGGGGGPQKRSHGGGGPKHSHGGLWWGNAKNTYWWRGGTNIDRG